MDYFIGIDLKKHILNELIKYQDNKNKKLFREYFYNIIDEEFYGLQNDYIISLSGNLTKITNKKNNKYNFIKYINPLNINIYKKLLDEFDNCFIIDNYILENEYFKNKSINNYNGIFSNLNFELANKIIKEYEFDYFLNSKSLFEKYDNLLNINKVNFNMVEIAQILYNNKKMYNNLKFKNYIFFPDKLYKFKFFQNSNFEIDNISDIQKILYDSGFSLDKEIQINIKPKQDILIEFELC